MGIMPRLSRRLQMTRILEPVRLPDSLFALFAFVWYDVFFSESYPETKKLHAVSHLPCFSPYLLLFMS